MKAVFPCKGVVILTKKDIETLESFYKASLATSKMAQISDLTEYIVQVGNFNYLPKKASLIVDEKNFLTISKLRSIMNNAVVKKQEPVVQQQEDYEEPISDDDITSHPFFTTLKPIN